MSVFGKYFPVTLKGMAMGAADVVPGVSGGTIAFISGIYAELLNSLRSVNLKALRILFREGIPAFWKHINGWFLLFLLTGIGISIVSLSRMILYLLENYPPLIWSFFLVLLLPQPSTWQVPSKNETGKWCCLALPESSSPDGSPSHRRLRVQIRCPLFCYRCHCYLCHDPPRHLRQFHPPAHGDV